MNLKKFIAVFAVLVMMTVPVMTMSDDGEATTANEAIKVSDLMNNPGTYSDYWLLVTSVDQYNMNLQYNADWDKDKWSGQYAVSCDVDKVGNIIGSTSTTSQGVFMIPSGCEYRDEKVHEYKCGGVCSEVEVCGTLCLEVNEQILSMTISPGMSFIVNGGVATVYVKTTSGGQVEMRNVTSGASNGPLTLYMEQEYDRQATITGSAVGTEKDSIIKFHDEVFLKDFTMSKLMVDFTVSARVCILSDFIWDADLKFLVDDINPTDHDAVAAKLSTQLYAAEGDEFKFALTLYNNSDGTSNYVGGVFVGHGYGYEEYSEVNVYNKVMLFAQQGIKEIQSATGVIFIEPGKAFDLTSIGVTCMDKYTFDGWYYINESIVGPMVKIAHPEAFMPTGDMEIYANAVYTGGDTPEPGPTPPVPPTPTPSATSTDYTPIIILGVFLAAIIALLAVVLVRRQ